MKAVLIIVIMHGPSGITSQQINFESMQDCQFASLAMATSVEWRGDYPDYPPDTRWFCLEVFK